MQAVRNVPARLGANHIQGGLEHYGGGDAIDIVITVDFDTFSVPNGSPDALHREVHVAEEKRIVKILDAGVQKALCRIGVTEAAAPQNFGRSPGHGQRFSQRADRSLIRLREKPAGKTRRRSRLRRCAHC